MLKKMLVTRRSVECVRLPSGLWQQISTASEYHVKTSKVEGVGGQVRYEAKNGNGEEVDAPRDEVCVASGLKR
jgi:hypothetical protein